MEGLILQLAISGQALGKTKSLEEILQILQEHKVKAIEIWPDNAPLTGEKVKYQEHRYEGRQIEKVKELTETYGIRVACVTMPGAFSRDMVSEPDVLSASLCYTIEVAKQLGAPLVNHYCAQLAVGHNSDIEDYLRVVAPAVKKAEELDVTLVLEPEAHDASGTPEGMLKILQTVGSEKFRTNFDPCNYYHASQEGFPFAYELLKDYIAYVHLKNGCIYRPEAGHSEESKGAPFAGHYEPRSIYYPVLPMGAVNIDGLLLRLQKDGYDGFCTLEPHTTPNNVEDYYRAEIGYLRQRGFFVAE